MRTVTAIAAAPFLATLVVLLGAAWAAHAQAAQQDFHWSGTLAPGQRVEVRGVLGSIRAEPADGDEVVITAVRRVPQGRVDDVRIERVAHDGGVTVCAVYPAPRGQPANRCGPGAGASVIDPGTRVDFVVRVPRGVHFAGKTTNGDVAARGMPADVAVTTVNGTATVSGAGAVNASTVNGAIHASTERAEPGGNLSFSTISGNITLQVPAEFRARVRASQRSGRIDSDFPLTVTRSGTTRSAAGEIGGGGRQLNINTVSGNITIRRAAGD